MSDTAAAKTAAEHHHPPDGPELTAHEEQKSREEESLSAAITYDVIRVEGAKQLLRTSSALAWSGLSAGLVMGFSMVAEGLLKAHLPEAHWTPLISKLGYTVGFLIVTLGSAELFTEQTLRPVVPLLAERTGKNARNVARLWAIVLVTNLIGTILFALAAAHTEMFSHEARAAFTELGRKALEKETQSIFMSAIIAGWLIAAMVWMLPAAKSSMVLVVIIMTYVIGITHSSHIIAGSTEVFYLVALREIAFLAYLMQFVLPTLAGNVLGGLTLVAILNHAQVTSGKKGKRRAIVA